MIEDSYKSIIKSRTKFGDYKKFEFHLHTPASYDYKLFSNCTYKQLSEEDIKKKGIESKLLSKKIIEHLLERYNNKEESFKIYRNFKEVLAYYLITKKLYTEKINAVIVCDHNTTDGFYKMETMSSICKGYFDNDEKIEYLFVLFGVEISCSEGNHLVCVQDRIYLSKVAEYLKNEIIDTKCGSYRDSLTLMKEFNKKFNSICYLAHHNTSKFYGSGAYKKELYNFDKMKIMGINNIDGYKIIEEKLSHIISKIDFTYVFEGDSHEIDSIGKKNTWVKIRSITFKSFMRAIKNRKISIRLEKPKKFNKYIKGIYIEYSEQNFLVGAKNKEPLILNFSPELNCIIGGRGTGKSTLLNIVDLIMSRESNTIDELLFLSKNEYIDLLIELDQKEYMLRLIPQVKDSQKYYYLHKSQLVNNVDIGDNGRIKIRDKWMEGYAILSNKSKRLSADEILNITKQVFRREYNINRLVTLVQENKISYFIDEVISYGLKPREIDMYEVELRNVNNRSHNKFLRDTLLKLQTDLDKFKGESSGYISGFNKKYGDLIKIVQEVSTNNECDYIEMLNLEIDGDKYFNNTNLLWDDVYRYIFDISKKIGYLKFLCLLLNKKYVDINKYIDIRTYVSDEERGYNHKKIQNGLDRNSIFKLSIKDIFGIILKKITSNREGLDDSIINYLKLNRKFGLQFNINNKESIITNQVVEMRNIEGLSLGQKVVALLTFVFEFGKFSGDNSVLIIDQPEDNLDNQYIYKNLVNSLREIKNERQVIIVTHSSTIVTNADAEQVIVMESDNKKAWIAKAGYPEDNKIIRHILNNLEGGVDSFKHKESIYNVYLK